jgi:hypothetical protein
MVIVIAAAAAGGAALLIIVGVVLIRKRKKTEDQATAALKQVNTPLFGSAKVAPAAGESGVTPKDGAQRRPSEQAVSAHRPPAADAAPLMGVYPGANDAEEKQKSPPVAEARRRSHLGVRPDLAVEEEPQSTPVPKSAWFYEGEDALWELPPPESKTDLPPLKAVGRVRALARYLSPATTTQANATLPPVVSPEEAHAKLQAEHHYLLFKLGQSPSAASIDAGDLPEIHSAPAAADDDRKQQARHSSATDDPTAADYPGRVHSDDRVEEEASADIEEESRSSQSERPMTPVN